MKNRPLHERVGFALSGLAAAWRREKSVRAQYVIGAIVLAALAALRPSWVWCAIIVLTVALVIGVELLNSAIEGLIDHLHPERHPEIRVVKDMAAGAVFFTCVAAIVVAALFVAAQIWP